LGEGGVQPSCLFRQSVGAMILSAEDAA